MSSTRIQHEEGGVLTDNKITIVSGLPRSGTSLLMQIMEAGGYAIMKDELRRADMDNPKGYYEFEKTKALKKDASWIPECRGKVIKIVSPLLRYLPLTENYDMIFIKRDLDEVLVSQKKMMARRKSDDSGISDEKMKQYFEDHLGIIENWLEQRQNINTLFLQFDNLIQMPELTVKKMVDFLHIKSGANIKKMAACVDKKLYRNVVNP